MEVNRNFGGLVDGFSSRTTTASYMYGSENAAESVSNVSNQGADLSELSSFEKSIYNEIEGYFEDSYKNMLTASVKITEEAMNLMESDDLFKDEVLAALSKQVWENQTDGVTKYHSVFEITEDGLKASNTTVSSFESTASKDAKESYAKSQASGSFITYGMDQSTTKVNLSSFVSSVLKEEDEKDYAQLWVQQAVISSYNSNISNSYSQSLLEFGK